MKTSEAVIYLAEARSSIQNDSYRSLDSLKGDPFFNITTARDETLGGGAAVEHKVDREFSLVEVLIPLVGDVVTTERLSPGQAQVLISDVTVNNPYKSELVNYLCFQLASFVVGGNATTDFDLDGSKNKLVRLFQNLSIYIGKFDGRRDDVFKISKNASGIFAFVIEGAFEVQNRLLHLRDGLGLWDITEVEFEALSNDAILLIIEVQDADQID